MLNLPKTLRCTLVAIIITAGMTSGSLAATVGVAVAGIGSEFTEQVATKNVIKKSRKYEVGTIKFYIPLSDTGVNEDANPSGVFGVDDYRVKPKKKAKKVGTKSDSCNGGCDGFLDMYLHFDGLTAGINQFSFEFDDLDLTGAGNNDPSSFAESLNISFFDSAANSLGAASNFSDVSDDGVSSADGNSQLLELDLVTGTDVWALLHFETHLNGGTGKNTIERVFASTRYLGDPGGFDPSNIAPVPVPGALPLFLTGLAAFGFMGARRRRQRVNTADHSAS